ncbi:hypothetical protein [Aurantimonas endophytica]|uniref:Uncharacterized protein n=1 Tax=Aurantimonas endophytica TaxID=1522175 RepID=A0A7W6MRZ1_9HYPH|nr:hypothetical protein [Aurantimonas endophytica]MBB4005567.1 hypothetical protein [Aurantimonas endophytica]MCO6406462.1 hypothetical protein [Aurantimonas endophytica]
MADQNELTAAVEQWQHHWHAILDREKVELENRPDPASLPPFDEDFRLHFALWTLDAERGARIRREAFGLLPCGELIADRVERHLRTPSHSMDGREAEAALRDGLRLVKAQGIDAPDDADSIRFFDASTVSYLEAFQEADTPFEALRDGLSGLAERRSGTLGQKAFFFLSEPLYRLASNYAVSEWVRWPLCSCDSEPDLTEPAWRLSIGGWVPGWDADGLFLYRFP